MDKKEIKERIDSLNKERKYYKKQSEWHMMMYKLTLRLEIIEKIEKDG